MYLLYRMGIFHVARGNTSMTRYHECVVFCHMLFGIWLFLYFLDRKFWYYLAVDILSLPSFFLLSSAPNRFGPVGYFGGGAMASGSS